MFIKRTTTEDIRYWSDKFQEAVDKLDALYFLEENRSTLGISANTIWLWEIEIQELRGIYTEFILETFHKWENPLKWPFSLLYKKEED